MTSTTCRHVASSGVICDRCGSLSAAGLRALDPNDAASIVETSTRIIATQLSRARQRLFWGCVAMMLAVPMAIACMTVGLTGIVIGVAFALGPLALVISGIWRASGAWRVRRRNRRVMQLALSTPA